MNDIRILLVEDHFLARMALSSVLTVRNGMKIVATAENGSDAIDRYFKHRPDVTIMDLCLPGISGFEAISIIRERDADARIVVLTNYDGSEDIYRALQAGATAYLLNDLSELARPQIPTTHCKTRLARPQKGREIAGSHIRRALQRGVHFENARTEFTLICP